MIKTTWRKCSLYRTFVSYIHFRITQIWHTMAKSTRCHSNCHSKIN